MKKIYIVRMTKYKIFNQDAIFAFSQGTLMKFMSFYQVKTTVDLVKVFNDAHNELRAWVYKM